MTKTNCPELTKEQWQIVAHIFQMLDGLSINVCQTILARVSDYVTENAVCSFQMSLDKAVEV